MSEHVTEQTTQTPNPAPTPLESPAPTQVHTPTPVKEDAVKIYALGGLEQIGINMSVYEYKDEIVIIDCGMEFPDDDMLGIDYLIADVTSLIPKKHMIKGIILTHGHMDHIGSLKHILPKLDFPPVWGTKMTLGMVTKQLDEFKILDKSKLVETAVKVPVKAGQYFTFEYFPVNHSIPDAAGVVLTTPHGRIVHTGDFKFDFTPTYGEPADLDYLRTIGDKGVDLLLSDSTNATRSGHTKSEKDISEALSKVFASAQKRIIITAFSTNIGRIQDMIHIAVRYGRTIYVNGRSMETNIIMAKELNYISAPAGHIKRVTKNTEEAPDDKVCILTTGSQGEEMGGLARMANKSHPHVQVKPGDTVIVSASPIPGNEKAFIGIVNKLYGLGAKVVANFAHDLHTSGHASAEDLKMMIDIMRPTYFLPVHGELYMRHTHKDLAVEMKVPEKNIFLSNNGEVLLLKDRVVTASKERIHLGFCIVDGKTEAMSDTRVMNERKILSRDGVVIILLKIRAGSMQLLGAPKIYTKGFIYTEESHTLMAEFIRKAKQSYETLIRTGSKDSRWLKDEFSHDMGKAIMQKTHRRPLLIPLLVESEESGGGRRSEFAPPQSQRSYSYDKRRPPISPNQQRRPFPSSQTSSPRPPAPSTPPSTPSTTRTPITGDDIDTLTEM